MSLSVDSQPRKDLQPIQYYRFTLSRGVVSVVNDECITSVPGQSDSKIEWIFVTIHGDPSNEANGNIMTSATVLAELRVKNP